jgi:hypothetical protein
VIAIALEHIDQSGMQNMRVFKTMLPASSVRPIPAGLSQDEYCKDLLALISDAHVNDDEEQLAAFAGCLSHNVHGGANLMVVIDLEKGIYKVAVHLSTDANAAYRRFLELAHERRAELIQ